jgi:hypothetical protein
MVFYERCPMSPLLIMGLQLINLFNLAYFVGFIELQIKFYLCSSFELYFAFCYDYPDLNYFEIFFLLFLPIIPTSFQVLLNFVKSNFYLNVFHHFYLVFGIMSYFLFVIFLNLFDLLSNVL